MRPIDIFAALTVVILWGLNLTAAKVGLDGLSPIFFAGLRFVIVAVILIPFVQVPKGQMGRIFKFSIVFGAIHFGFLYTGIDGVDSSAAAITLQLGVPFSIIFAWIFLGEKFGLVRSAGLAMAFAGVVVLTGDPDLSGNLMPLVFVAIGIGAWAASNVMLKSITGYSALSILAWASLFSAGELFLLSAFLETGQVAQITQGEWLTYAMVLYTAIPATLVAHSLWYYLISKYDVNVVVPYNLLTPVVGVIGGIWILSEPFTWQKAVGGLTTLIGVSVIQFRTIQKAKAQPILDEPT